MDNIILWGVALSLLAVSFYRDRAKTVKALMKSWKAVENILPQLIAIILIIGTMLALFDPETISALIGNSSGWFGVVIASFVGAITLIPGFIAFPTASMLLSGGAGYMQIGAFISSLMMVGVVTFPLERKYFGTKISITRNLLAFAFSFIVAFVIGKVVG